MMDYKPDKPISPGFIDPSDIFQMVQRLAGKRRYYSTMGSGANPAMSFGDPSSFQAFLSQSQQRANALTNNV